TSAARSIIRWDKEDLGSAEHVDTFLAMFYHRLPLLGPKLDAVGIGVARSEDGASVVVIDCSVINWKGPEKVRPVLYPSDGQKGIPLKYGLGGEEFPDPRPDKTRSVGYPITVICAKPGWE